MFSHSFSSLIFLRFGQCSNFNFSVCFCEYVLTLLSSEWPKNASSDKTLSICPLKTEFPHTKLTSWKPISLFLESLYSLSNSSVFTRADGHCRHQTIYDTFFLQQNRCHFTIKPACIWKELMKYNPTSATSVGIVLSRLLMPLLVGLVPCVVLALVVTVVLMVWCVLMIVCVVSLDVLSKVESVLITLMYWWFF